LTGRGSHSRLEQGTWANQGQKMTKITRTGRGRMLIFANIMRGGCKRGGHVSGVGVKSNASTAKAQLGEWLGGGGKQEKAKVGKTALALSSEVPQTREPKRITARKRGWGMTECE